MSDASPGTMETKRPRGPTRKQRAILLVGCVALGSTIGWLGARISGSDAWYLAIPACMALVWLFIADPSQCARCDAEPESAQGKTPH